MAHHVGRELAGEFSPVGEAPEELRRLPAVSKAEDAQVEAGVIPDVFEILARAGDQEELSLQLRGGKARGDPAQHASPVQVFRNLPFVQQDGDIAAVALVPAVVIHVRAGAHQLHKKGRGQDVFHAFASKFFSYVRGVSIVRRQAMRSTAFTTFPALVSAKARLMSSKG